MSYEEEEQSMAEREALFDEQQMESERYKELEYISSIPIVDLIQNPHVKQLVEEIKTLGDSTIEKWPSDLSDWAAEALAEWRGND